MARKRSYQPLSVFQNGRIVGRLNRETSGAIDFRYDIDWLAWDRAFAISLSLPLREDRYIGAPVLAVFDNLLPDGEPIRKHIAERVGAQGADTFSLLTALGQDCVGALQFLPEGIEPSPAGGTKAHEVSAADIAHIIRNLGRNPLGVDQDEGFRISIAGAQEKTALLWREGRWYKPTGSTATTHIIKPQIGKLPNGIDLSNSVENEYLCLKLVSALGVPTAETEIAEFEDQKALVVKRFDRRWLADGRLMRLPQEDFCQALSVASTRKYQPDGGPGIVQIIELLKSSDTPEQDIATFMRANIIFWLLGATDGHAKNFSIFLNPTGFRLTPLYDVLSSQPSLDANQIQRKQFKLAMSVGKNRHYLIHQVLPRHYVQTAEQAGISLKSVATAIEELRDTAERSVTTVINGLGNLVPQSVFEPIQIGIIERIERLGITEEYTKH
jgi:serine/threonine-protein kinase HipA